MFSLVEIRLIRCRISHTMSSTGREIKKGSTYAKFDWSVFDLSDFDCLWSISDRRADRVPMNSSSQVLAKKQERPTATRTADVKAVPATSPVPSNCVLRSLLLQQLRGTQSQRPRPEKHPEHSHKDRVQRSILNTVTKTASREASWTQSQRPRPEKHPEHSHKDRVQRSILNTVTKTASREASWTQSQRPRPEKHQEHSHKDRVQRSIRNTVTKTASREASGTQSQRPRPEKHQEHSHKDRVQRSIRNTVTKTASREASGTQSQRPRPEKHQEHSHKDRVQRSIRNTVTKTASTETSAENNSPARRSVQPRELNSTSLFTRLSWALSRP